jgi:hypothetical protein
MALKGAAKAAYMAQYEYPMAEYMRYRRAYASPRRRLKLIDLDVLRLSHGEPTVQEIAEALDLSQGAVRAALTRVAVYMAPTIPPPQLMVKPDDCVPFHDEVYRP